MMSELYVGVSDKLLMPWLLDKEYIDCSDEGESVAIAAGYYLSTGHKATAFMSADGFFNALNFITSWIIPEKIPIHLVISIGRTEPPHFVASQTLEYILTSLIADYGVSKTISYEFVRKE